MVAKQISTSEAFANSIEAPSMAVHSFVDLGGAEMNVSHASVHPVEDVPTIEGGDNANAPRVRMKDIQGMPGTASGLSLRVSQFIFAAAALSIMASTSDFPSITAFWGHNLFQAQGAYFICQVLDDKIHQGAASIDMLINFTASARVIFIPI